MRTLISGTILLTLAACGGDSPDGTGVGDYETSEKGSATAPAVALSEDDLLRVCKAGMSSATGADIPTMTASVTESNVVRISYVRDDGKAFAYDCKIEGSDLRTRMIDEAGPGTGPGAWSGRGSTVTFEVEPNAVTIHTIFFDGSSDDARFDI